MVETIELTAVIRENHGKTATRRLRRIEDMVPGIVYGAGKDSISVMLPHKDISKALTHETTYSSILTLIVGNKKEKVVLKALQRHPSKPRIMHIDFLRIKASEKLTMTVPIHFTGEQQSPGLQQGGIISKSITEIEIKCLPANLPEALELDISKLELDQSRHLSDLKLPPGVEFTVELNEEHNLPIVSVHMPKISKEDIEAEAAEAALAAEAAAESSAEDNRPVAATEQKAAGEEKTQTESQGGDAEKPKE